MLRGYIQIFRLLLIISIISVGSWPVFAQDNHVMATPSPTPKPSPTSNPQMENMPGMKMPAPTPSVTSRSEMKMPMPSASPSSPAPMAGMDVGWMNMGSLLVMSGDEMGVRV